MSSSNSLIFDNSFQKLPSLFFETVVPTPLTSAKLLSVSESCRRDLGIEISNEDLALWLNGEIRIPGDQQISTRYAGHQFGVWAGQLGDGRAISLGELQTKLGKQEIQTKGSGLTPFSRMGDGKAVIRSSVREFMASEALHHLGIPTTRALALIIGTDDVYREQVEKSGLVARVFPTNIRIGHFEYAYHFGHHEELQKLTDYTREYFFKDCRSTEEMLYEITKRTAKLMALWQSIGFCHGVMNSDNMSILGITIDYGPFGFMETFNPEWICNHSDPQGRYSYQNQPFIGLWNLDRLMQCFSKVIPVDELKKILATYEDVFWQQLQAEYSMKLGLHKSESGDPELCQRLLFLMQKYSLDFTYTFRELPRLVETPQNDWLKTELKEWLTSYRLRLQREQTPAGERIRMQDLKNPKFVLRNYIAQEVIAEVETGKTDKLENWMKIFRSPFENHSGYENFALPTPLHLQDFEISCSS